MDPASIIEVPVSGRVPASTPPAVVPQRLPGGWQQCREVPPVVVAPQINPEQHSVLSAHPVTPAVLQLVVVARRQKPCVQRVPVQHSVSSTQGSLSAWHPHVRVVGTQSMYPQQSRSLSQRSPCRWQHRNWSGVGRQSKSWQQSAPERQVPPAGPHIAQVPFEQFSVPAQLRPSQHGRPTVPQVAVAAPQRLLRHTRPVEHDPPGQHACPIAPHCAGRRHTPVTHSVPRSHARPLQQGCIAPPHTRAGRHCPPTQFSPSPQEVPSQHGCISAPQAEHIPPEHPKPAAQRLPVQQRCERPPQSSERSQTPSMQIPPVQHSLERSQRLPMSTQQCPSVHP